MGCCASTEAGGNGEPPARRVAARPVEVVWETSSEWHELNEKYRQYIGEDDQEREEATRVSQQPEIFFAAVRSWLDKSYRDCARTGSIEELKVSSAGFMTSNGCCNWPSKQILTLDSCFTGVFLAATFIIAAPLVDGEARKPGAMLETPEMEGAKALIVAMFQQMELGGSRMDHAEIHIFMGADMVRGKWRPSTKEPTISRFGDKPSDAFRKTNEGLAKDYRGSTEAMAMFLPLTFMAASQEILKAAPGGTVWDEGELPFLVAGKPYPHATRLLVARNYREMDSEVDATHYKVSSSFSDPQDINCQRILRNAEPDKDPGGIAFITLLCALPSDSPWPRCGAFHKTAPMVAAEAALIKLVKKWNRQGKVQRCIVELAMGSDRVRFSFVGEDFHDSVPPAADSSAPKKIEGDIDGFLVKLLEEPKHKLFDSESHFQAVKAIMQEKTMQDPERSKAMIQQVAIATTQHFMEMNYPGTEISNEELPAILEAKGPVAPNSILMVARDPKKEQKSIVAVIYSVPSPDGESPLPLPGSDNKNWLGTQEMKDAVAVLLDLMKQWYKEGKVSGEDCIAQVMMGLDADCYQFVDGERFEDCSEERMKLFNWG